MAPSDYSTFFQTTAGAAAALIGLLFVAVSIEPHATVADDAPARRGESANTFTALVNALLTSLWALLPDAHLALPVIGVAAGSIVATLLLGWDVLHDPSSEVDLRWRATLLGARRYSIPGVLARRRRSPAPPP